MSSPSRRRGSSTPAMMPIVVGGVMALAGMGVGVAFALRQDPPPPAVASPEHGSAELAAIERRLERIEAALGRLAVRAPDDELQAPRTSPAGARRPATTPVDDASRPLAQSEIDQVLAALQRTEDALRRELQLTREVVGDEAVRGDTLERIRDEPRPIDWYAWDEILELWNEDPDLARKEVKLLTDEEVLDRFGTPTDVWSNTNGITWQYARDLDATTGKYATEVILRIPAGFVTQLAVRYN